MSDREFVDEAGVPDEYQSNIDAGREDKMAEESEVTGRVSGEEVEGLKDSIGGGQVLDDSAGYTRGAGRDKSYQKQEDELDAAVEETAKADPGF